MMENYYFMRAVLKWLASPSHYNRLMAFTLRAVAVLIIPYSLVPFFKAGKVIFDLPASGILGGVSFQVFFVVAIYCVVHTLFIRARDIDALPGGDYNMFPLVAILLKAMGETIASFIALIAIGGGIFVWFTGKGIVAILNPPPRFLPIFGDTTFMGGIEFMVGGILSAIALLAVCYLISNALRLIEEVAERQRSVRSSEAAVSDPGFRLRSGSGR
jgi:hypothetical protein